MGASREPVRAQSTPRGSHGAPAETTGGHVQMRSALLGKPYDEQVAMLSPNAAPVQLEQEAGAAPAAEAPKTEPAPEPPKVSPYAYSAAELKALLDDVAADKREQTAQQWIKYGVECNRYYVRDQVKQSNFTAFEVSATFENEVLATFPGPAKAALAATTPRADWLVDVMGTYLSGSPVSQEMLASDKGTAGGEDDKSAALTEGFIKQLDGLEAAMRGAFAGDAARAVKELTVRREMFKLFLKHHNKSNAESGISSAKQSVQDKGRGVTSCNAYQGNVFKEALGNADAATTAAGEGGMDVKQTTTVGWDMKEKKVLIGPKKRNYGFYDVLGRAAKEVGAWTDGGPGARPKAGDMYILAEGKSISHIGFFKFAETLPDAAREIWHTFDGGQQAGTPMTAEGFTSSVRDGALNNIKRVYTKADNSVVIPQPATLAQLRGQEAKPDAAPVQVNQDGKVRTVAGFIDVGKLLELDKQPAGEGD